MHSANSTFTIAPVNTVTVKKSNNALVHNLLTTHLCVRSWLIGIKYQSLSKNPEEAKRNLSNVCEKPEKQSNISQLLIFKINKE